MRKQKKTDLHDYLQFSSVEVSIRKLSIKVLKMPKSAKALTRQLFYKKFSLITFTEENLSLLYVISTSFHLHYSLNLKVWTDSPRERFLVKLPTRIDKV